MTFSTEKQLHFHNVTGETDMAILYHNHFYALCTAGLHLSGAWLRLGSWHALKSIFISPWATSVYMTCHSNTYSKSWDATLLKNIKVWLAVNDGLDWNKMTKRDCKLVSHSRHACFSCFHSLIFHVMLPLLLSCFFFVPLIFLLLALTLI